MHNDENDLSPLPGDSQIEHPTAPDSQGEVRLVQELQAMYDQEKNASIERVWTRLASQRASSRANIFASPQPGVLDLQKQRQFSERNVKMQSKSMTPTPPKGLPRLLGLLAATLVIVALVGSLLLVLNATRSQTPATGLGSKPSTRVNAATATPISSPECRDVQDQADQTLCLEHAETMLNISKTFGTHKVTFVRAYANTTRLLLVYTTSDSPHSDAISFMDLTIQQGITLSSGASHTYENPKTHQVYYVEDFDTHNVPAGTTELHIRSIVDGFSGQATPLNFTLPLHRTATRTP